MAHEEAQQKNSATVRRVTHLAKRPGYSIPGLVLKCISNAGAPLKSTGPIRVMICITQAAFRACSEIDEIGNLRIFLVVNRYRWLLRSLSLFPSLIRVHIFPGVFCYLPVI